MSWYLAIDTATDTGSVALGPAGAPRGETLLAPRSHAAQLVPALTELLGRSGAGFDRLQGIVVADGPGSFTGLRIGFATAQGLMRAHEHLTLWTAPSTLGAAAVARRLGHRTVATLYDALRGEVFGAVYHFGADGVRTIVPATLTTVDGLLAATRQASAPPDAVVVDTAALAGRLPAALNRVLAPPVSGPRASALLELVGVPGGANPIAEPWSYEPDYGRRAEAQVKWEGAHGSPLPDPGGEYR